MKRVEPCHKQPSKPQTLAELMEADKLAYQRFKEYMEWCDLKNKFQHYANSS